MPDPRQLIELVDTWRARGDDACATELEKAINNEENRAGIWVPIEILERHAPHLIPEHHQSPLNAEKDT